MVLAEQVTSKKKHSSADLVLEEIDSEKLLESVDSREESEDLFL